MGLIGDMHTCRQTDTNRDAQIYSASAYRHSHSHFEAPDVGK